MYSHTELYVYMCTSHECGYCTVYMYIQRKPQVPKPQLVYVAPSQALLSPVHVVLQQTASVCGISQAKCIAKMLKFTVCTLYIQP